MGTSYGQVSRPLPYDLSDLAQVKRAPGKMFLPAVLDLRSSRPPLLGLPNLSLSFGIDKFFLESVVTGLITEVVVASYNSIV